MRTKPWIDFERRRGVIWVCDVQDSTSSLNDDNYADAVEEYLPRLLWIGEQIVESAGGEFIKWTGDGFLAWFDCEVERKMGREAAAVFDAAWHLSFSNNITNLAVKTPKKFTLRHGITWEPDALVMNITHSNQTVTRDLLGRKIVLAFRCSGVRVDFPHIVTETILMNATHKTGTTNYKFVDLKLSDEEILRYFKGIKQSTRYLVGSSTVRKGKATTRSIESQIKQSNKPQLFDKRRRQTIIKYINKLNEGPPWAKKVLEQQIQYLRKDMLFTVEKVYELFSGLKGDIESEENNREIERLSNHLNQIINKIEGRV